LDAAIAILMLKGVALGQALALEQELEDDRAAVKADAIGRIMKRDGLAATPAEKIVETDEEYFRHRAKQRASIVSRFRADAEYQAAKSRATAASFRTPALIELELLNDKQERRIDELTKQRDEMKRESELKEIALRRANGQLADRIKEVEELTGKSLVPDQRY
jgi:vacuolar-type H+-ATPase subunit I/STV1